MIDNMCVCVCVCVCDGVFINIVKDPNINNVV